LAAAGVLALSAGFAANYLLRGGELAASDTTGEADVEGFFAASMPDLAGRQTSLAQWRGKVLVVNFWATWCVPCREEIPDFVRMQAEFGDKGVQFVGIAADQADKVALFANEFQINYPLLIGNYGALDLAKRMGNRISALPFTVVLDGNGRMVYRQLGILKVDKIRSIFAELLVNSRESAPRRLSFLAWPRANEELPRASESSRTAIEEAG
jgi:thiol-disulfide isomerase/thioredoxin